MEAENLTASEATDPRGKLLAIERELGAEIFERGEVIRSLLLALVAGEHVLLLGPPGTAKSHLSRSICERIDAAAYFSAVLYRGSMPDEIFGPNKLSALREDRFERNTEVMLPEAQIAFIDEIFKSNSAVLNGMLPILNERAFKNGGRWHRVPLEMAVAASNEMPEDREELGALYDRLLVRHVVRPVKDDRNFEAILLRRAPKDGPRTTVTLEEIARAREGASRVDLSAVAPQMTEIRHELAEEGIEPSVRRFDKGGDLVRASAYLGGRGVANEEDLAPLRHVLWEDPEQIPTVRDKILSRANPFLREAQDLADEAEEVARGALAAEDVDASARGAEANRKLKGLKNRLLDLRSRASASGRSTGAIDEAIGLLTSLNKEVLQKCLGADDI